MTLQQLLGIDWPLIQAPMAGVQGHALAAAVSNAGALGSLPCAMLGPEALRSEIQALKAGTQRPFNLNFFCHETPQPDAQAEAAWRAALAPYAAELGLDPLASLAGASRAPFGEAAAALVEEFKPAVVSFHFGCRRRRCWRACAPAAHASCPRPPPSTRRCGCRPRAWTRSSPKGWKRAATAASFLSPDLSLQQGTFALLPQVVRAVRCRSSPPAASPTRAAWPRRWRWARPACRSARPTCCARKRPPAPCIAPRCKARARATRR